MPVDPQIQNLLETLNDRAAFELRLRDLAAARELFDAFDRLAFPDPDPIAGTEDLEVAGRIPVRRYLPRADAEGLVLYFHGGGFALGSIRSHDGVARHLAATVGVPVASVEYRLAPEHPFPAAVEDALAVLEWAVASEQAAGGPLAVAGDSAGGGLAAVAAISARDQGVALAGQLLLYPATDGDLEAPSIAQFAEGYFLTGEDLAWFGEQLKVPEHPEVPWWAAPVAADLHGLAPAIVAVAGYDPIRDWGIRLAEKLRASGVPVSLRDFPTMIHGFASFGQLAPSALAATDAVFGEFASLLATGELSS